jgi:hypothetical protein
MPPAYFTTSSGMATRLPARFFAGVFRSYGEGNEMLPLNPRAATAAAGWHWRCCLLRWLLFIRALLMLDVS